MSAFVWTDPDSQSLKLRYAIVYSDPPAADEPVRYYENINSEWVEVPKAEESEWLNRSEFMRLSDDE